MTSPYGQIPIRPAGTSIMSFRANGHSDESAVGDLVDNCVDAGATEIKVIFKMPKKGNSFFSVSDNGSGMDAIQLAVALTLGPNGNREPGDLGKFGLGMKFASIAMGRHMEVLTRIKGGDLVKGTYDIDVIQDPKTEWTANIEKMTDTKIKSDFLKMVGDHGTIIQVTKLDRLSSKSENEFHKRVIPQLGLTYHRLMDGSKLNVFVNGTKTRAMNPLEPLFEEKLKKDDFMGTSNYLRDEYQMDGSSFTFESVVFEAETAVDLSSRSKKDDAPWRRYFSIMPRQADAGVYILRNGRFIQHRPITDFGHVSHPSQNHLRLVLSFGDELDEALQVPNAKNSIGVGEKLKGLLVGHIKARIKFVHSLYTSRKVKDKDKEINDAEKEVQKAVARVERDKNLQKIKANKKNKRKTSKTRNPMSRPSKPRGSLEGKSQFAPPERVRDGRTGTLIRYVIDGQNRIQLIFNIEHPFYTKFIGVEEANKSTVTKLFEILLFSFVYSGEKQGEEKDEMSIIMDEHLAEMSRVTRLLADAID